LRGLMPAKGSVQGRARIRSTRKRENGEESQKNFKMGSIPVCWVEPFYVGGEERIRREPESTVAEKQSEDAKEKKAPESKDLRMRHKGTTDSREVPSVRGGEKKGEGGKVVQSAQWSEKFVDFARRTKVAAWGAKGHPVPGGIHQTGSKRGGGKRKTRTFERGRSNKQRVVKDV